MPTIKRTNPKGQDIRVSDDGLSYSNDAFVLQFQDGPIHRHGVRNGAFDEEILLVLIHRAESAQETELADTLRDALAVMVPDVAAEAGKPVAAEAATDVSAKTE